jgi:acyl carrier protein
MNELEHEIKCLIVEVLHLEEVSPDEIDSALPLFGSGEGLGLDSIDALELGVALRKKYSLQIQSVSDDVKQHFRSVSSLAAFVHAQKTGRTL